MSFGDGDLHERVEKLELVNGELCATINKQQEDIYKLRALVEMYDREFSETITWVASDGSRYFDKGFRTDLDKCRKDARELGIDVGGEPYEFAPDD